ncbi:hypothetical protein LCGC14_1164680 [marine sediment metagenome]|uniref:Uncharacterized protein n=1 Tax=marine sediment metagenome TaxID=412755 RepID=A0A0F9LWM9_9ZZZZ
MSKGMELNETEQIAVGIIILIIIVGLLFSLMTSQSYTEFKEEEVSTKDCLEKYARNLCEELKLDYVSFQKGNWANFPNFRCKNNTEEFIRTNGYGTERFNFLTAELKECGDMYAKE